MCVHNGIMIDKSFYILFSLLFLSLYLYNSGESSFTCFPFIYEKKNISLMIIENCPTNDDDGVYIEE